MNTKNVVVSATLLACVAFAVTVSAQNTSTAFTFTLDGIGAGFRVPIEAKVVKGAPFSADIVTESIQTLADGNRIVQRSNTRFYRDSEGRVRREEDRGARSPLISITDPVSGMSYSLDPENKVARQTPNLAGFKIAIALQHTQEALQATAEKFKTFAASQQLEIQRQIETETIGRGGRGGPGPIETARAEQIKVEQLPARDIEGVRAQGTRRTTTILAGAIGNDLPIEIVSEEWTAPDLKVLVMTERRDPRLGTSTYRLTNINRAEPDHYLFEVPSDYTVKESGIIRKTVPKK